MFPLKLRVSSKIISFLIIIISSFILGTKTNIEMFYLLFSLFVTIVFMDILLLAINLLMIGKIQVARKMITEITENEYLNINLTLYNKGIYPLFNIELNDFLGCASKDKHKSIFIDWLKPKKKFMANYSCICEKRGKYTIGPVTLTFYGLLGIVYAKKTLGIRNTVYVYPQTFEIKKTPSLTKGYLPWFGLETIPSSGEDDEFFGLREYKFGDPLKRIHWLSVARKNKLMVKEFQRCSFYQVTVIFILNKTENAGKGKESVSEYIIKIAASLTRYFIEKNICIEILAHAGKLAKYYPSNKGKDYMEEIFKFYAEAEAESKISVGEFLYEYYNLIPHHSTLFIILTEKNIDTLLGILHLKELDISIVALVVISATFSNNPPDKKGLDVIKGEIISRLYNAKIEALLFCKGDNLEEIFS